MDINKLEGRSRGSSFRRRALTLVGVSALTLSGVGAAVFGASQAFAAGIPLSSSNFIIGSLTSVTGVSATVAPTVPGGTSTYKVTMTLTTAATAGTITIVAPAGTTLPGTAANYVVTDFTTPSSVQATSVVPSQTSTSTTNNKVVITPAAAQTLAAGDQVLVAISGVVNTNVAGSYTLTANTSTDLSPVSATYSLSGTAVTSYGVSTTTPAVSATATYSINGVTAAAALNAGIDGILIDSFNSAGSTVTFPAGATNYSVTDVTSGASATVTKVLTAPTAIGAALGQYVIIQTPVGLHANL